MKVHEEAHMNPHSVSTHRPSHGYQPKWWLLVLTAAMLPLLIFGGALTLGAPSAKAAPAGDVGSITWSTTPLYNDDFHTGMTWNGDNLGNFRAAIRPSRING